MTLRTRKLFYLVLGSGALFMAIPAMFGLVVGITMLFQPPDPTMSLLERASVFLIMGAAVAGAAAGLATIRRLPVAPGVVKLLLTAGTALGGALSGYAFVAALVKEGASIGTFYLFGLPVLVAAALLVELWRPHEQPVAGKTRFATPDAET